MIYFCINGDDSVEEKFMMWNRVGGFAGLVFLSLWDSGISYTSGRFYMGALRVRPDFRR